MTLSCATGFPDKTRKPPKKYKKQIKKNKKQSNRGRNSSQRWRRGVHLQVSRRKLSNAHALRASSQSIARQTHWHFKNYRTKKKSQISRK